MPKRKQKKIWLGGARHFVINCHHIDAPEIF
jgi:hypothetical protein